MSSLRLSKDWNELKRDFGWASALQDYVGMGVDQVLAIGATEKGSGHDGFGVAEGMSSIELFPELALAPGATKLSIESPEGFGFGIERVLIPFDGFPGENRV